MDDDIDIEIEIEDEEPVKKKEEPPKEEAVVPAGFDMSEITPVNNDNQIFAEMEKEERACEEFVFDQDRLLDPNYLPYMQHILSIRRRKLNTMTYDEFKHFEPLFDSHNTLSGDEKNELFKEWQFRISLYEPVEVYKNGKLIYRIPPVFARTETIDAGVSHDEAEMIVSAFGKTCINDQDYVSDKGYRYADMLKRAFTAAQKKHENERNREELAAAAESLVLTGQVKVNPSGTVSNNEAKTSDTQEDTEGEIDESDVEYL